MCRLKCQRFPKKCPKSVEEMAHYQKKYFNTEFVKSDPEVFIEKDRIIQKVLLS